jgi:hypothetical protein
VADGCQMPAMVNLWRKTWSKVPGTTDQLAPFGIVTLASGGSEGGSDIGGMRWSQVRYKMRYNSIVLATNALLSMLYWSNRSPQKMPSGYAGKQAQVVGSNVLQCVVL